MKWLFLIILLSIGCDLSIHPIPYSENPNYPETFDTKLFGTWHSVNNDDALVFKYVDGYSNFNNQNKHFLWYNPNNSTIEYCVVTSGSYSDSYEFRYLINNDTSMSITDSTGTTEFKRFSEFNNKLLGSWVIDSSSIDSGDSIFASKYTFLGYVDDFGKETSKPINLITNNSCDTLEYSYFTEENNYLTIEIFNYDEDYHPNWITKINRIYEIQDTVLLIKLFKLDRFLRYNKL